MTGLFSCRAPGGSGACVCQASGSDVFVAGKRPDRAAVTLMARASPGAASPSLVTAASALVPSNSARNCFRSSVTPPILPPANPGLFHPRFSLSPSLVILPISPSAMQLACRSSLRTPPLGSSSGSTPESTPQAMDVGVALVPRVAPEDPHRKHGKRCDCRSSGQARG